jgi:hypothetical protein
MRAQIVNLAREAEHRTKNILSTVRAAVRLSQSDTSYDLKELIEGHIEALAKSPWHELATNAENTDRYQ